jgi:hypothetical protein
MMVSGGAILKEIYFSRCLYRGDRQNNSVYILVGLLRFLAMVVLEGDLLKLQSFRY